MLHTLSSPVIQKIRRVIKAVFFRLLFTSRSFGSTSDTSKYSSNTGIFVIFICGLVIGALVLITAIIAVTCCCVYRRRPSQGRLYSSSRYEQTKCTFSLFQHYTFIGFRKKGVRNVIWTSSSKVYKYVNIYTVIIVNIQAYKGNQCWYLRQEYVGNLNSYKLSFCGG